MNAIDAGRSQTFVITIGVKRPPETSSFPMACRRRKSCESPSNLAGDFLQKGS